MSFWTFNHLLNLREIIMQRKLHANRLRQIILAAFLLTAIACSHSQATVKDVMDNIVTRLYEKMDEQELSQLDNQKILQFISQEEQEILATKYWLFDVNVPVVVSIMRHIDQRVAPFWLTPENGYLKTDLIVKNEEYTYQVWQKSFDAGRVELGINGFDKHRPVYFISVAPQQPTDQLELSHFSPENQFVSVMDVGAFTYHDWDELVLTQVPPELKGQKLLTTIRGRAREAHLINAFRKTPFPATVKPDQIMLTWSEDPRNSQTIQWRTNTEISDGVVRYREKIPVSNQDFYEVKAQYQVFEDRLLQNDRYIHRFTAVVKHLTPATAYIYSVGSPAKNLWSDEAEFITAPDSATPFTFVYFGDTHKSPHWGKLANAAFQRHPNSAFYTIAGDLVNTGLYRDDWDHFFAYGAEVIKNRPLVPTLGNHDAQDGLGAWMYLDLFALPLNGPSNLEKETVYSFEYSNALFIILDVTSSIQKQVTWLEQQLSTTRAKWKFAVFHFPPYMYKSDYPDIRKLWGAVFDKYHLDIAMSGHVHYYVRSNPMFQGKPMNSPAEGTIYITSVAIPARNKETPDQDYAAVHFGGGMFYQTLEIDGNRLVYRVYNIEGKIRDELVITK